MGMEQSLNQFIDLLREHTSLPLALTTEARTLLDRLVARQLHLAVLGQFKRGKSTLINALLGDEILPSGVLPVTLVPVFLRFGKHSEVEVHFSNGHLPECHSVEELGEFVNEANNPENVKHISQVDLYYPSNLLQNGIVLIDTPGVGSTRLHNTETTLDFLPRCDAAIVVLSADPPITAAEVGFLLQMKSHIACFFFILNKIDYLDAKGIAEATVFLRNTLKTSAGIETPQIFPVSARQGLQARRNNDERLWSQSGMAPLQQALAEFAVDGKQLTLVEAIQKKAVNLVLKTEHLLALEQQAAQMPLVELEQKIAAFKRHAQNATQQRQEIMDRLNGDAVRLREQIEEFATELRAKARPQLMELAEQYGLPTDDEAEADAFHRKVRQLFDLQQAETAEEFRQSLRNILMERAQAAAALREALRRDAAALLAIPHVSLLTEEIVVDLAEQGWTIEHLPVRIRSGFGSKWLPKSVQHRQYAGLREKLVNELTTQNVEKIRWWLLQTLDESINRFRRKITAELEETVQQIDYALQTGYQCQQSTTVNQQQMLNALESYRTRLHQIRQAMDITEQADKLHLKI